MKELNYYLDKIADNLSDIKDLVDEYGQQKGENTLLSIPNLHESKEKILIDFLHVIDRLKYNTNQVIILLRQKERYSPKQLEISNARMVTLSGRYAGARNSFAWLSDLSELDRTELNNIHSEIQKLISEFNREVNNYNTGLDKNQRILTMNQAYQKWLETESRNGFFDDQIK